MDKITLPYRKFFLGVVLALCSASPFAQLLTLPATPLYIGGANVRPMVMLSLTKDQELYKRSYDDYTDLDGDGQFDTTYKHSITYYGYFDSFKCYSYVSARKRFEPQSDTSGLAAANQKYCDTVTGEWSGNFLNWATMTRIDSVRKIFFGGARSPTRINGDGSGLADGDTTTGTVLERAFLPTDAHAFAKYYDGTDIAKLTHFTPTVTTTTSVTSRIVSVASLAFTVASTTNMAVGDIVEIASTATPTTTWMRGAITAINGGTRTITVNVLFTSGSGTLAAWTIKNMSKGGITVCNTTLGGAIPQDKSQTNTNLPRMRVAQGNYALWSANERWQCRWSGEASASNANSFASSGLAARSSNPAIGTDGTDTGLGDFFVRVQVCVAALLGTERCKQYPTGPVYKPIGLLQVYGEPGLIDFGLMTGSYDKNVSGGVLRKNAGTITNEINSSTGQFLLPAGGNIITSISKMRIYGYNYGDGSYLGAGGDNCDYQLTTITQGNCTSWGNPMSEIFYETLRYYAGGQPKVKGLPQPTAAYNTGGVVKDAAIGLPTNTTWADPISESNYCAPLNVIMVNSSVSSYDNNQIPLGSTKSYLGTIDLLTPLNASITSSAPSPSAPTRDAEGFTKLVGDVQGYTGNSYFFGRLGASGDELCSAKQITNANHLGKVSGLCPEGPTVGGSYLMAGLAYTARIRNIRSDITPSASQPNALKVATYAVQLSSSSPRLEVTAPSGTQKIIIQPACRLNKSGAFGGCALVEMKIVSQEKTETYAKTRLLINWEDSEQGGDYDQDMMGTLEYCIVGAATSTACPGQAANTIRVTTKLFADSTANGIGFGFVISGTTKDGPHFYSGRGGFNYSDPSSITVTPATNVGASGGCNGCQYTDAAKSATFSFGASGGQSLQDPMWLAAKFGGFTETSGSGNSKPDVIAEWDSKLTNGSPGSDGIPDNYFLVTNPSGLETALDKAFVAILTTSSASSVATNSTSLNTGSRVYQARFNSSDWSGQLMSLPIDINGVIATAAEWDTGQIINAQDFNTGRVIITMNSSTGVGVPFRWASISATQQAQLSTNKGDVNDGLGSSRLDYVRGSGANEGLGAANFRRRVTSKLGDIINSNPQYVGPPSEAYSDAAYRTFKSTYASRTPMLVVGSNDGMLHIIDASANTATSGKVLLSYVPTRTFYKLSWLTEQNYAHRFFVNGTPTIKDVYINGAWRTVAIGTYAEGGQGVFALDITDPSRFSEDNASSIVLWEFTDAHTAGIGNAFGQVQIAKMNNDKWAAIVHSGFNNTYSCNAVPCTYPGAGDYRDSSVSGIGTASIHILFIEDGVDRSWSGSDWALVNTGVGGSGNSVNGASGVRTIDTNADGKVDYLYFGDQRGNLWKWNVTNASAGSWANAIAAGTPLYSAKYPDGTAQIITTTPELYTHPSGGYLVYFGTGQYIQTSDPSGPYTTNTMYGIWDKPSHGQVASVTTRTSATLLQQTVFAQTAVGSTTVRVVSSNAIDWSTHLGWYMDLPNSSTTGERIVADPFIQTGKLVYQPLMPSTLSCDSGGTSFLMEVDPLTGGRLTFSVFDINGDKNFSSGDFVKIGGVSYPVSGVQTGVGITPKATVIAGGPGKEFKVLSGSTGGLQVVLENPNPASTSSITRRSWRELLRN